MTERKSLNINTTFSKHFSIVLCTMGVNYQVRIRFLRVIDRTKVNLEVIHAKEVETWEARYNEYFSALKKNLAANLAMFQHKPCVYGRYSMFNVNVHMWYDFIKRPDVLAISNYANGPGEEAIYTTTFYDRYGAVVETSRVFADYENNNCFMIYVPKEARYFNYRISPTWQCYDSLEQIHYFNRGLKCLTCAECKCKRDQSQSDSESQSDYSCNDEE